MEYLKEKIIIYLMAQRGFNALKISDWLLEDLIKNYELNIEHDNLKLETTIEIKLKEE